MRKFLFFVVITVCKIACAATYTVTDARFGANGSDTEDDSYAIQNALNMAKGAAERTEVVVPAGTYLVSFPLGIYSNTKLTLAEGAAIKRTVGSTIKVMLYGRHLNADGSECPRDAACSHGGHSQIKGVEITGGVWDGGMDTESVTGAFALLHGEDIKVRNVTFRHFTEHIVNFSASKDVVVEDCIFEDALRFTGTSSEFWSYYDVGDTNRFNSIEAVHLDVANEEGEAATYPIDNTPCENVTVARCVFRGVFAGAGNHHSIPGVRQNGFAVDSCSFTGLVSYAVHAHGFTNCVVKSSRADACAGIVWARSASFAAKGNVAASCARHGYFVTGSDAVIDGNVVDGAGMHGVYLDGGSVMVSSNAFRNCGQSGVRADRCAGLSVVQNEVRDSSTHGINVFGGEDIVVSRNIFAAGSGIGLSIQNAEGLEIDANELSGFRVCGVFVKSCDGVAVVNNAISDVGGDESQGVSVSGCRDVDVSRNTLVSCKGSGIIVSGSEGCVGANEISGPGLNGISVVTSTAMVASNSVKSAGQAGYYLFCATGSSARDNRAEACSLGFDVVNSDGVALVGNTVADARQHGVAARNSESLSVVDCRVSGSCARGITVSGGSATVEGCWITSPAAFGICAENGADIVVCDNQVERPGSCGVRLIGVASAIVRGCAIAEAPVAGVSTSGESAKVVLSGNTIRGCGVGFGDEGSLALEIVGNTVSGSMVHGISLNSSAQAKIDGNTISEASGRGITVSGGTVTIYGNDIRSPGGFGLYVSGCTAEIFGNSVSGSGDCGMRLVDLSGTGVCGNVIEASESDGMRISGSTGLSLADNEIRSVGGRGMLLSQSRDCDIIRNLVDGSASDGLFYQYSASGCICSNEVVNAGGIAIYVAGDPSSATVACNLAASLSGHDIRIGEGAMGCVVTGNICQGGGVGIVQSVLPGTTYVPSDCRACATRAADGSILVEWVPAKIAAGAGSYIVEYATGPDGFVNPLTLTSQGADSDHATIDASVARITHVRVRFDHTISGAGYVSSGDPEYIVEVGGVRYRLNPCGGTGGDQTAAGTVGQDLPPVAVPARAGYAFNGYWTGRDGTGTQIYSSDGSGAAVCAKDFSPAVLYADWVPRPNVEVAFILQDDGAWTNVVSVAAGTPFVAFRPDDPVRTGHEFAGWLMEDGTAVPFDFAVPDGVQRISLHAAWNLLRYSISFSANGGTGGSAGLLDYGAAIVAPIVSRPGHEFIGWFPSLPKTMPAENMTYVAQWRVCQYGVRFDAAGGVEDTNYVLDYGAPLKAPTVTRAGHAFAGWSPAVPATVPDRDTRYVAQWRVNSYRISFDAAGGTGGLAATMNYGAAITAPEVTRAGYDFIGWHPAVDATVPAADMTYVAQWTKTPDPDPAPGTDPEPADPEPETDPVVRPELFAEIEPITDPAAVFQAATIWDGWLESDGEVLGTIQAKVAKLTARGAPKVTVSVVEGGRKIGGRGQMEIGADGSVSASCALKDGRTVHLAFGQDELYGTLPGAEIRGARTIFTSRRADDKQASEAVLARLQRTAVVYWNGNALSVVVAKKGKCKVSGNLSSGARVSASSQLVAGEAWCAVPVAYAKRGADVRFVLWMNRLTGEVVVEGLGEGAKVQWATVPGETLRFRLEGEFDIPGATVLTQFLPSDEGLAFSGGKKWILPKGGAVKLDRASGEYVDTKPGTGNPSGLKLTYNQKTGAFKGSFKVHAVVNGRLKKYSASVVGIMVGDVGYGTATIKKFPGVEISIR